MKRDLFILKKGFSRQFDYSDFQKKELLEKSIKFF
jgi:hypothetical protein